MEHLSYVPSQFFVLGDINFPSVIQDLFPFYVFYRLVWKLVLNGRGAFFQ